MSDQHDDGFSRRDLLATGAVIAGAAMLPAGAARAQIGAPRVRPNMMSAAGKAMMADYRRGIEKMLDLPPEDPRNWYRMALTHFLDCPHGNWWILPWHRGFTLQVEGIIRELSGNPRFAIPFWDWTATVDSAGRPVVPDMMFEDNVLNPDNKAFIGSAKTFQSRFAPAIARTDYWKPSGQPVGGNNPDANGATRFGQLINRSVRFPDDLWYDLLSAPGGPIFFEQGQARSGVTRAAPQLDALTTQSVALSTIYDALGPKDFITFGSAPALNHDQLAGFGVLEGKPHNKVHNNVGGIISTADPANPGKWVRRYGPGFMQANLSPVDPLFFLHHSNLDRLWDVWTRKQLAMGLPALPEGDDLAAWRGESFMFFIDSRGRALDNLTAGNFESTVPFNYVYERGTGEDVVPRPLPRAALASAKSAAPRIVASEAQPLGLAAGGLKVLLPRPLLQSAGMKSAPRHYAKVLAALPHGGPGAIYYVEVHSGDPANPVHVETISMFGHHSAHGPIQLTVPITSALQAAQGRKALRQGDALHFRVLGQHAAGHGGHHLEATAAGRPRTEARVLSVTIEQH
jgi:tyrosinase